MARQTVLIVDDEVPIRVTLVKFLKSLGVQDVLEAANGQEALEKVGSNPQIKLIIMDLKMPVMDGLQALEKIRAVNAQVKVAILTGYPFYEQADQAVKNGEIAKADRNDLQSALVEGAWAGREEGLMAEAAEVIEALAKEAARPEDEAAP